MTNWLEFNLKLEIYEENHLKELVNFEKYLHLNGIRLVRPKNYKKKPLSSIKGKSSSTTEIPRYTYKNRWIKMQLLVEDFQHRHFSYLTAHKCDSSSQTIFSTSSPTTSYTSLLINVTLVHKQYFQYLYLPLLIPHGS